MDTYIHPAAGYPVHTQKDKIKKEAKAYDPGVQIDTVFPHRFELATRKTFNKRKDLRKTGITNPPEKSSNSSNGIAATRSTTNHPLRYFFAFFFAV